jgi:RNA polymerase sigma-70 factor, ECF subfamily
MGTLQARLARGDQTAFAELYDSCADRVGHYLLVRLGSREDAGDALQETFLRLARTRDRLATVENVDAYVFAVARNEAARLAANRARREARREPLAADELFCNAPGDAEARDNAEAVAAAFGHLAAELREVVELKTSAGLTLQQISQVTGVPQGTVATRYRTALAKLETWLARQLR